MYAVTQLCANSIYALRFSVFAFFGYVRIINVQTLDAWKHDLSSVGAEAGPERIVTLYHQIPYVFSPLRLEIFVMKFHINMAGDSAQSERFVSADEIGGLYVGQGEWLISVVLVVNNRDLFCVFF